jgi:hypothetical protein
MKYFLTVLVGSLLFGQALEAKVTSYQRSNTPKSYVISGGEREHSEVLSAISDRIGVYQCEWSDSASFANDIALNGSFRSEKERMSGVARLKLDGCGSTANYICGGSMVCSLDIKDGDVVKSFVAQFDGVMCQSTGACGQARDCFLSSGILSSVSGAMDIYGASKAPTNNEAITAQ